MKNLAGDKNADTFIKEELFLAGIEPVLEKSNGEVPYTLIGKVGNWTLRRAWYYWIASVEDQIQGLPLDVAMKLHNTPHPTCAIMGNTVRSGGHCGCPSPDEYGAEPVYDEDFYNQLVVLGYKKQYSEILGHEYVPITVGEVSELCKLGKIKVSRYVDSYHIDDQIGLNEFVKTIKSL